MDREDILSRLKALDMRADVRIKDNKRYSCIIVGGGALMLLGFSMRVTDDVDVLKSDLPKELFSVMNELDMNTNVSAYNSFFPWDYFSRAQLVDLDTEKIDFYTISIEDLVISKIAAHREKDLFDIMNENVIARLDFSLLDKLAEELKYGMLNDYDVKMFEISYNEFLEYVNNKKGV